MITSHKLLNLWDMLKEYSLISSRLATHLSHLEDSLRTDISLEENRWFGSFFSDRRLKISQGDKRSIEFYVTQMELLVSDLQLDVTGMAVKHIRINLGIGDYTKNVLVDDIRYLRRSFEDELKARQFFFVERRYTKFYQQPELFGPEVNDYFHEAMDDIQNAGTALALGQGTSCVMHLMRASEVALKALAKELDISYGRSWEDYLSKVEKNLSMKHTLKPANWREKEVFYRDMAGDLTAIKQAWRNPTMHPERTYTTENAELILMAIKALMQHMARHLQPKAKPVLTVVTSENAGKV